MATVLADLPGTYSCMFTAETKRECDPQKSYTIGPETGKGVDIRVQWITFSGAGMRAVSRDDGSGVYPTPHWMDNSDPADQDNDDLGDHNIPVVYARNSRMYLSASFTVEPADALSGTVTVTGDAAGAGGPYRFEQTVSAGGTITIMDVPADRLLVNHVEYLDPMTIHWTITPSNGDPLECGDLPDTSHRVYVTLGPPNPGPLYESVVHLGCTNAQGQTQEANTVAAIWSEFTDRIVRRKPKDGLNYEDNVQMTYWNPPETSCQTMEAMLAQPTGNGTCVAWSRLFDAALEAQGIGSAGIVEVTPIYTDDPALGGGRGAILVKNWTFAQSGSAPSGCSQFTHVEPETTDDAGVPAQGNSDPPGAFLNHFIIGYAGQWYDPSYGNGPFAAELDWENASIDGYRKLCASLPGDVRKQNDATLLEMQFLSP